MPGEPENEVRSANTDEKWKEETPNKYVSVITTCVNPEVLARGDENSIKYTVKPPSGAYIVQI